MLYINYTIVDTHTQEKWPVKSVHSENLLLNYHVYNHTCKTLNETKIYYYEKKKKVIK